MLDAFVFAILSPRNNKLAPSLKFAILSPRNNKLAPSLKFVGVDRGGGGGGEGEGNSIVFHQSFLTHSACQCDVT